MASPSLAAGRRSLTLLGQESRLEILRALQVRPRTAAELGRELGMTVQGASKHIRAMMRRGWVEFMELQSGAARPRRLYRLAVPVMVRVSVENGVLHMSLWTRRRETPRREPTGLEARHTTRQQLEELEDERLSLLRRIRRMEIRLTHIFDQHAEVIEREKRLMSRLRMTGLQELFWRTAQLPDAANELAKLARELRLPRDQTRRVLRELQLEELVLGAAEQ